MALALFSPRYLTRFACLGADCPDACCSGWEISVDEQHYRALAGRMAATPEEAAELAAAVRLEADPRPGRFALMVLRDDRSCSMFGADHLCRIQARYGEEYLPNTCAVFPRQVGYVAGRMEQTGNVSCPEVARLCLLADDSLDMVPIERDQIVRGLVFHEQGKETYDACLDPVRGALTGLLGVADFPLATRLFFVASLAERTRSWLRRGGMIDGNKLSAALGPLRRVDVLDNLAKDFAKLRSDQPFPLVLVHQALTSRLERASQAFLRLCAQVADSYGPAMDHPAQLWIEHKKRAAAMPPDVAARLDAALGRYCRNFVLQEWFTRGPSLLGHVQSLAVRMAVLRFLLVSHPGVVDATDEALVETVYSFTRTFDQQEKALDDVVAQLRSKKTDSLGHIASLLKV